MVMNFGSYDINVHMLNHYKRITSAKNVINTRSKGKNKNKAFKSGSSVASSHLHSRYSSPTLSSGKRAESTQSNYQQDSETNLKPQRNGSAVSKKENKRSVSSIAFVEERQEVDNDCPNNTCISLCSETGNGPPLPTPRSIATNRSTSESSTVPEFEYLQFSLRITEDIIRNDLYTNKEMQRVFNSHIEANRGRLSMKKMLEQINLLCKELNIGKNETTQNSLLTNLQKNSKKKNKNHGKGDDISISLENSHEIVNQLLTNKKLLTDDEIQKLNDNDLQDVINKLLNTHDTNENFEKVNCEETIYNLDCGDLLRSPEMTVEEFLDDSEGNEGHKIIKHNLLTSEIQNKEKFDFEKYIRLNFQRMGIDASVQTSLDDSKEKNGPNGQDCMYNIYQNEKQKLMDGIFLEKLNQNEDRKNCVTPKNSAIIDSKNWDTSINCICLKICDSSKNCDMFSKDSSIWDSSKNWDNLKNINCAKNCENFKNVSKTCGSFKNVAKICDRSKNVSKSCFSSNSYNCSKTESKICDSSKNDSKTYGSPDNGSKICGSLENGSKILDSSKNVSKICDSSKNDSKTCDSPEISSKFSDSSKIDCKSCINSKNVSKTVNNTQNYSKMCDSSKNSVCPLNGSKISYSSGIDSKSCNSSKNTSKTFKITENASKICDSSKIDSKTCGSPETGSKICDSSISASKSCNNYENVSKSLESSKNASKIYDCPKNDSKTCDCLKNYFKTLDFPKNGSKTCDWPKHASKTCDCPKNSSKTCDSSKNASNTKICSKNNSKTCNNLENISKTSENSKNNSIYDDSSKNISYIRNFDKSQNFENNSKNLETSEKCDSSKNCDNSNIGLKNSDSYENNCKNYKSSKKITKSCNSSNNCDNSKNDSISCNSKEICDRSKNDSECCNSSQNDSKTCDSLKIGRKSCDTSKKVSKPCNNSGSVSKCHDSSENNSKTLNSSKKNSNIDDSSNSIEILPNDELCPLSNIYDYKQIEILKPLTSDYFKSSLDNVTLNFSEDISDTFSIITEPLSSTEKIVTPKNKIIKSTSNLKTKKISIFTKPTENLDQTKNKYLPENTEKKSESQMGPKYLDSEKSKRAELKKSKNDRGNEQIFFSNGIETKIETKNGPSADQISEIPQDFVNSSEGCKDTQDACKSEQKCCENDFDVLKNFENHNFNTEKIKIVSKDFLSETATFEAKASFCETLEEFLATSIVKSGPKSSNETKIDDNLIFVESKPKILEGAEKIDENGNFESVKDQYFREKSNFESSETFGEMKNFPVRPKNCVQSTKMQKEGLKQITNKQQLIFEPTMVPISQNNFENQILEIQNGLNFEKLESAQEILENLTNFKRNQNFPKIETLNLDFESISENIEQSKTLKKQVSFEKNSTDNDSSCIQSPKITQSQSDFRYPSFLNLNSLPQETDTENNLNHKYINYLSPIAEEDFNCYDSDFEKSISTSRSSASSKKSNQRSKSHKKLSPRLKNNQRTSEPMNIVLNNSENSQTEISSQESLINQENLDVKSQNVAETTPSSEIGSETILSPKSFENPILSKSKNIFSSENNSEIILSPKVVENAIKSSESSETSIDGIQNLSPGSCDSPKILSTLENPNMVQIENFDSKNLVTVTEPMEKELNISQNSSKSILIDEMSKISCQTSSSTILTSLSFESTISIASDKLVPSENFSDKSVISVDSPEKSVENFDS